MKKLFCVVVSDAGYSVGLDSPVIFHIKCKESEQAKDEVKRMMVDEYRGNFNQEVIDELDIFSFEVTDVDIIKI
jgi:hypothetical protein